MKVGQIRSISGPLVIATGLTQARLFDTVRVGEKRLLGEIIEVHADEFSIQVYEPTEGLGAGDPVVSDGVPLQMLLGPGLLGSMLDGIGQNLGLIADQYGTYLPSGASVRALDTELLWTFVPLCQVGDTVSAGDILGEVRETEHLVHRIMVPADYPSGTLLRLAAGDFRVMDEIGVMEDAQGQRHSLSLATYWPIRIGRPFAKRLVPSRPLVSGQRVIDTFFPIAKGGTGCVPGPFGSGKTVVQHQLAKWSDVDVVVYVGCGERGNEMTDVIREFSELEDPIHGGKLMARTILVANTSNMPVAAREASIYTGLTIAEYYRDMGYDVALMADSTSRFAEALREMSGRLRELPGDEGYPTYLASRLAALYERAARTENLGKPVRQGSVTMIGAVSPSSGDLSEPVTQATLQYTRVFWALDAQLAFARHFPAINVLNSYSLYDEPIHRYWKRYVHRQGERYQREAMKLLQQEVRLQEVVQLIGADALSDDQKLILEAARMLREDFLKQNAFQPVDQYTSLHKQAGMLECIMEFTIRTRNALQHDKVYLADLLALPAIKKISQLKWVPEESFEKAKQALLQQLRTDMERLVPQEVV